MTSAIDKQTSFDHDMRTLHASAVAQVSPQTLARLRSARHAMPTAPARTGVAWPWLAASLGSAVLAIAIGVQFLPQNEPANDAVPQMAVAAADERDYPGSLAALDENPDLYIWLASTEAAPLAME